MAMSQTEQTRLLNMLNCDPEDFSLKVTTKYVNQHWEVFLLVKDLNDETKNDSFKLAEL